MKKITLFIVSVILLVICCKKVPFYASEGSTLVLSINNTYLPLNKETTITVLGFNSQGEAIHDHTMVYVITDLGEVIPDEVELINGKGEVKFKSDESGIAKIYAKSGNIVSETIEVKIGSASLEHLTMSANPSYFDSSGGVSEIRVFAFDMNGNLLSDIPVVLSSSSGNFEKGGVLYTDKSGMATDYLYLTRTATVKAQSGSKEVSVEIIVEEERENELPNAEFSYSPQSPYFEETVYFNAEMSNDSDGKIVSYEWDFGDGSYSRGVKVSHIFSWSGNETEKTFNVILKVKDDRGGSDTEVKSITIKKR